MEVTSDHYAKLGLDRRCTTAQIRSAFRLLAKRHHPDANGGSAETAARFREINLAHEVLSDPARRRAYDQELAATTEEPTPTARPRRAELSVKQDVFLRLEEFLRGTDLEVRVKDPMNPGVEIYPLNIPPDTAPGARFRIARSSPFDGGFVQVRVRPTPGGRLKAKGSDLKCDLRITARRAMDGGTEMVTGIGGRPLRVTIPRGVPRGTILQIPGEGLPKPRGGRGNLLVRITFRAEVRVTRR